MYFQFASPSFHFFVVEFDEKDRDCIDESNSCVKANGRRAKTAWKIPEFLLPSS